MTKYNWSIYTIEDRLLKLKKLLLTEANNQVREQISYDIAILENYLESQDVLHYDELKLLESYDCVKEDFSSVQFLISDFIDFYEYIKKPLRQFEIKNNSLSKGDILDLTHDFYKSLDRHFYSNFMKQFRLRNNHIRFRQFSDEESIYGQTIVIPSLNEFFVDILRKNTIEDVLSTIHEYMHITSFTINPNHGGLSKHLFREIDSLFSEISAIDFLYEKLHDDNLIALKIKTFNDFFIYARDIYLNSKLIECEETTLEGYTNNKLLKQIAKYRCDIDNQELVDILNNTDTATFRYLIGYLFALELYNIFTVDKDKALYILNKIITLNCYDEEAYYNEIKKLGLIPNLSLREIYTDLKTDSLRLSRK